MGKIVSVYEHFGLRTFLFTIISVYEHFGLRTFLFTIISVYDHFGFTKISVYEHFGLRIFRFTNNLQERIKFVNRGLTIFLRQRPSQV